MLTVRSSTDFHLRFLCLHLSISARASMLTVVHSGTTFHSLPFLPTTDLPGRMRTVRSSIAFYRPTPARIRRVTVLRQAICSVRFVNCFDRRRLISGLSVIATPVHGRRSYRMFTRRRFSSTTLDLSVSEGLACSPQLARQQPFIAALPCHHQSVGQNAHSSLADCLLWTPSRNR